MFMVTVQHRVKGWACPSQTSVTGQDWLEEGHLAPHPAGVNAGSQGELTQSSDHCWQISNWLEL